MKAAAILIAADTGDIDFHKKLENRSGNTDRATKVANLAKQFANAFLEA